VAGLLFNSELAYLARRKSLQHRRVVYSIQIFWEFAYSWRQIVWLKPFGRMKFALDLLQYFMHFSGASTTLRSGISLIVGAAIASAAWAFASGPQVSSRSDAPIIGRAPSISSSNRRNYFSEGLPQHRDPGFQRRRPARIIVVPPPAYYYSPYYFLPTPAVVNASFFCLEHGVGFISRVGILDHLGGTHKFALEHAAAICPADVDTCVFDGRWPLY
jgi:hypothetical protein